MQLIHFLPKNEVIQKHIECYHIFNYEEKHLQKKVLIYPHYLHTISIQNTHSSIFLNNQFTYLKHENKQLNFNILGRFTKPLLAKVDGNIKALSIVFKPTGINFFCDESFEKIVPETHNSFPFWNDKATEFEDLLNCDEISELTSRLEEILLLFYRPYHNKILFETLSLLHSNYSENNVEEIAKILSVNRKTLLRQFKKNMGVSMTDYRRILRFREAINKHAGTDESLTKLAYEMCFSDQSHFIKDVQKLTGVNPKRLFKEAGFVKDTPFFLKIN